MTRWYPIFVNWAALGCLLLATTAGASSPFDELPDDPLAAWAKVEQDVLPAVQARTTSALAKVTARQQWFEADSGDLDQAFPDLVGAELQSVAVVQGLLRELDAHGAERARQRRIPVPDLGDEERDTAVRYALKDALDAEEQADALQRRLLLSQLALLSDYPSLTRARLDRIAKPWSDAVLRPVEGNDQVKEQISEEAAHGDRELQRLDLAVRGVRESVWHGRASPVPSEDLARLAQPTEGAVIRLALVLPTLSDVHQAAVGAPLDEAVAALAGDLQSTPTPQLAAAHARWTDAPEVLAPLAAAHVAVAEQVVQATAPVASKDSEARLQEALELQQRDGQTADILRTVGEAQQAYAIVEAAAVTLREETTREAEQRATLTTYQHDLERLGDPVLRAKVNADASYAAVRELQSTLRAQARGGDIRIAELQPKANKARKRLLVDAERVKAEVSKADALADTEAAAKRKVALEDWKRLIEQETEAWTQQLADAEASREQALQNLVGAATLRRGLRKHVGSAQRAIDRADLVPELVDELSMVGPSYLATQRARLQAMQDDPFWFLDLNLLYDLLAGSIWLLLAGVLWWVARRYANGLVNQALQRVAGASEHLRPADVTSLREPLHRVFVTVVDVCAAWLLFGLVPEGLPELGVVLVLVFEIQLLRLVLALFDVLVIRPPSVRPSLLRLGPEAWLTARRTVQAFALWFVINRVLHVFAIDVLHGFASEQLVSLLGWLAFVVLVIVFLYAWAPHTRARVKLNPGQSWITKLLGADPPTQLLSGPQALGGMVFLGFVLVRSLLFRIARSGVGPLGMFAAFDRLRLGRRTEEEVPPEPLSDAVCAELRAAGRQREVLDRPKARDALFSAIEGWKKESRQGLAALLGDDGDGRGTALKKWQEVWREQGLQVHYVAVDERLIDESDALDWLHRALKLPRRPTDPDDAVALMSESLAPGIWVVEQANRAFLRTVGGFGAFQTLLYVLHGDGHERFWLLSVYRPAWRYLERLSSLFSMHMFRAVVDLPPLNDKDLRGLTLRMADRAGYHLDFGGLVSGGALAGDPEVEAERAVDSFYRLLASASAGNPAVALDLWLGCMALGDAAKTLRVRIDRNITVAPVSDVSDDQLFVLAALRTQGQLMEREVAEVTNMNAFQVRAIVRTLEGRGILQRANSQVHIVRSNLPAVTLTLRRRHFLHWT